jgi:hypothetical protein
MLIFRRIHIKNTREGKQTTEGEKVTRKNGVLRRPARDDSWY